MKGLAPTGENLAPLEFLPFSFSVRPSKKTLTKWQLALYNDIPAHKINSCRDTPTTELKSAVYLGVHYDRWRYTGSYILWGITPDPNPKRTGATLIEMPETRNPGPTVKKNAAIESLGLGSAALGLLDIGDVRVTSLRELMQVIQGPNAVLIFPNLGASALAATAS